LRKKEFLTFVVIFSLLLVFLVFAAPFLTTVTLTSSSATNTTVENLTVTTDQDDNASVKLIYNWIKDGTSLSVLNMPFENNTADTSSTTGDYSGYENDGTITGATWNATGGYDGWGAYYFDGSNNYITLSNEPNFDFTENFSMTAWIYLESAHNSTSAQMNVYSKRASYSFALLASGKLDFSFYDGSWTDILSDKDSWEIGWYHVAGTWDSDSNDVKLYINGVENGSGSYAGTPSQNNYAVAIGIYGGGLNTADFKGTIDDAMIFNYTLSPEQVQALYENRTDLIVSQETSIDSNWNVTVTPNDGSQDGTAMWSNTITILEEAEAEAVPEFSDYAIALLLLTVVGGFFVMRRNNQ
jgi:hypothetical protein